MGIPARIYNNNMDINSILEQIGWGRYQIIVIANVFLSWATVNFWFVGLSITINQLTIAWGITEFQAGLIGSAMTAGQILGLTIFGWIADTKGRIYTQRIVASIDVMTAIALTFANDYYIVLCAFFFVGLTYASDSTNTSVIITDFTPLSKRWIIPLLALAWIFGSTICSLQSYICNLYELEAIEVFRVFCIFAGSFHFLSLMVRLASDESPRFLLATKQYDRAEAVLRKMARLNKRELTLNITEVDIKEKINPNKLTPLLEKPPDKHCHHTHTFKSRITEVYTKPLLPTTLKLNGVFIGTSFNAVLSHFLPLILVHTSSVELSQSSVFLIILLQQISTVPGFFLASKLVDSRLGRRWTCGLGFISCGILIFVYMFDISYTIKLISSCLAWLLLYIGLAGMHVITCESFYTHLRAFGFSVCSFGEKLCTLALSALIGLTLTAGYYYLAIAVLAGGHVMSGLFAVFVPETKGREADDGYAIFIILNFGRSFLELVNRFITFDTMLFIIIYVAKQYIPLALPASIKL